MAQSLLIGVGAGVVAGLLFASLASGSLLAVLLFYLAPLPILIAALGWSHIAGIVAAITGAVALLFAFNLVFALAFLIGIGLPAWWLGYLAMLARPVATNGSEQVEWYPVGRLVFWAAMLGGMVVTAAIPQFGADAESFRAALKNAFEQMFRLQTGTPADKPLELPGVSDPNLWFDFFARIIPPMAAAMTTTTLLVNLWLSARIVNLSGRLQRPWPDLTTLSLPAYSAVILAVAMAGTFFPGMVGIVAGLFASTFTIAFAVLGLAVMHALTAHLKGRMFILIGVYAAILLLGWPMLAIMFLGLADAAFDLRSRTAQKHGPPSGPVV